MGKNPISKKKKVKSRKTYSEDAIGLMQMIKDMGHTPVSRFGNIKQTTKALKKMRKK